MKTITEKEFKKARTIVLEYLKQRTIILKSEMSVQTILDKVYIDPNSLLKEHLTVRAHNALLSGDIDTNYLTVKEFYRLNLSKYSLTLFRGMGKGSAKNIAEVLLKAGFKMMKR